MSLPRTHAASTEEKKKKGVARLRDAPRSHPTGSRDLLCADESRQHALVSRQIRRRSGPFLPNWCPPLVGMDNLTRSNVLLRCPGHFFLITHLNSTMGSLSE